MRFFALVPLLVLAAPVLAQESADQEKEEARLLRKARRLIDDGEKAQARDELEKLSALAQQRGHDKNVVLALSEELKLVGDNKEDEARVLDHLSHYELRSGDFSSSARHLERLAELRPDDARLANNLGYSLHMSGKDEAALKSYERCIELDPDYSLARITLGQVARLAGKPQRALRSHEKLLARAKEGSIGTGSWFYAFESEKEREQGKGSTFDTDAKKLGLVRLQVALDHAFLDDLEETEKAIKDAKAASSAEDLAPAIDKARDDLERALELRPAHFQLHYALALLAGAKGDDAGKKAELEKFVEAEKKVHAFATKAKDALEEK